MDGESHGWHATLMLFEYFLRFVTFISHGIIDHKGELISASSPATVLKKEDRRGYSKSTYLRHYPIGFLSGR